MSFRLLLSAAAAALALASCQTATTRIVGMADLPLKTTEVPAMSWQQSPLRANAQYLLYGTNTAKQKADRLGDYYYVEWYDADPTQPVKLVMHYTQARTASKQFTRTLEYPAPREDAGHHKAEFFFNGPERKDGGDILTWKVELYSGGKLMDSRQSYLWE